MHSGGTDPSQMSRAKASFKERLLPWIAVAELAGCQRVLNVLLYLHIALNFKK